MAATGYAPILNRGINLKGGFCGQSVVPERYETAEEILSTGF
jgi:hypothetical protein